MCFWFVGMNQYPWEHVPIYQFFNLSANCLIHRPQARCLCDSLLAGQKLALRGEFSEPLHKLPPFRPPYAHFSHVPDSSLAKCKLEVMPLSMWALTAAGSQLSNWSWPCPTISNFCPIGIKDYVSLSDVRFGFSFIKCISFWASACKKRLSSTKWCSISWKQSNKRWCCAKRFQLIRQASLT